MRDLVRRVIKTVDHFLLAAIYLPPVYSTVTNHINTSP